jgi:hypothetical protein
MIFESIGYGVYITQDKKYFAAKTLDNKYQLYECINKSDELLNYMGTYKTLKEIEALPLK